MLRLAALLGAVGAAPSLAACASSARPGASKSSTVPVALAGGGAREAVSLAAAPNLAGVVAGIRAFGNRLHGVTASTEANWTASPLSIDVAFGMLRAGCRGSSGQQVDGTFGFAHSAAPEGSPHAALNALTGSVVTTEPVARNRSSSTPAERVPAPIVAVANGLFLDRAFAPHVRKEFLQLLGRQYGAAPATLRFADAAAAKIINAWVSRQTRGRINKLFDRLDPTTQLVLVNAVYLKATWIRQFDPLSTRAGAFTAASGRVVRAQLMHEAEIYARYAARDGWQRVTLAYTGDELTMRVVVPTRPATSVADLGRALLAATEPHADESTMIDLALPKWETATDLPLVKPLEQLGLTDIFSGAADLSGIAPGLFVNDAIHRANITVDEQGTEAAAVTGIGVATSAPARAQVVRVDRPFAWAIVHEPTGTPVFAGHVVDPTAR